MISPHSVDKCDPVVELRFRQNILCQPLKATLDSGKGLVSAGSNSIEP